MRMALELNMLEAVDESLLQLTSIERTRAVSMAQQETVALAQILKVCATILQDFVMSQLCIFDLYFR